MHYKKPALSFEQQYDLLENRGLTMVDRLRALRWLKHVSYYRLSAYLLPFKTGENFNPGTTFEQVTALYVFDRKLRLTILDGIERIEVALRTALTYELAHAYGPFGYTDARNFDPGFDHDVMMTEVYEAEVNSRETFCLSFPQQVHARRTSADLDGFRITFVWVHLPDLPGVRPCYQAEDSEALRRAGLAVR